ncbi:MAG: hypothetical protein J6Q89_01260 [Clostridia bacterium]|nr:hypothetical protein [Clostridia bacterium]
MYICKPERSVFQTRVLLFTCVLVTLSLFFISTVITNYSAFVEFCGFASLMLSILFVVRYSLTEFEYSVCDNGFSVTKIVGNKRQVVCNVALETAVDLLKKRDYDHLPSNQKAIIKYSLNQNIKADSYVFLCEFNGKRTMIEFEPNNEFVAILKNEIKQAKANDENDI